MLEIGFIPTLSISIFTNVEVKRLNYLLKVVQLLSGQLEIPFLISLPLPTLCKLESCPFKGPKEYFTLNAKMTLTPTPSTLCCLLLIITLLIFQVLSQYYVLRLPYHAAKSLSCKM